MLTEIDSALKPRLETKIKWAEIAFLRTVHEFGLAHAFDQFRSSPVVLEQPRVELTIIPGKFLPVVCGQNEDGEIITAPLGKIVASLKQRMNKEGIESYFLLTSGAAKEAVLGAKPFSKTRTNAQGAIPVEWNDPSKGKPRLDGDIILVTDRACLAEDLIAPFAQGLEISENHLKVKYNFSPSRPFPRIEIFGLVPESLLSFNDRERWSSIGHIFFPQANSIHDPTNSLISHVFSQDTNAQYILLVKTNSQEEFVGVAINFFPTEKRVKIAFNQNCNEGRGLALRKIKTARIPCFSNCFPMENSPAEAYSKLWHLLREVTWDNHLRLITDQEIPENPQTIKEMAKKTSIKFAREIVYVIAEKPNLIINNPTSMRQHTNRTFEGLTGLLNGDPYLGYQYLLPAGLSLTDAPIFGMGIIDPKGLFPPLYRFLAQKGRFEDLLHIMERCDWGAAQVGWSTFVAYIYEQTGRNLRQVDELLCPVFCSNDLFPTLVDNYVRKALSRFYDIPLRNPLTGAFPQFPPR